MSVRGELGRQPDDEVRQSIKQRLGSCDFENLGDVIKFFNLSAQFKILFPDHVSELNLDDETTQVIDQHLEMFKSFNDPNNYLGLAWASEILFPGRCEFELDEARWNNYKGFLEDQRQEDRIGIYTSALTDLKIVLPEYVNRYGLDNKIWQDMKDKLDTFRGEEKWLVFGELASNLKVLAAEEIKTTDQGLELVMPKQENFKEATPPRPERKELN
ncbi:MAG: hypothetical protein HQ530_04210 [Parcubacteria group bacterium]|nr:hypothetical protein [Parcubacteria group bacterium]